jgi:hypothetical protein
LRLPCQARNPADLIAKHEQVDVQHDDFVIAEMNDETLAGLFPNGERNFQPHANAMAAS